MELVREKVRDSLSLSLSVVSSLGSLLASSTAHLCLTLAEVNNNILCIRKVHPSAIHHRNLTLLPHPSHHYLSPVSAIPKHHSTLSQLSYQSQSNLKNLSRFSLYPTLSILSHKVYPTRIH